MGINLLTLLKLTQVLDLKMYNISYSHKTVSYFKNFYIYCNFVFKKIILCFLRLSPDMFDTLIYCEKKLMFFFSFLFIGVRVIIIVFIKLHINHFPSPK